MRKATLKISAVNVHGKQFFAMYEPAAISSTGKTRRRLFADLPAAQAARAGILARLEHAMPGLLTPAQSLDARQALQALHAAGLDTSLYNAVLVAIPSLTACAALTVAELCGRYQAAKIDGWSTPSRRNFARVSKCLVNHFPRLPAIALTLQSCEEWLAKQGSKQNQAFFLRTIRPAFSWAVKRGILPRSPFAGVDMPRAAARVIDVYTPAEAARLMDLCPPGLQAAYLLLLFAGVRPAEVDKLRWADYKGAFLHISPAIAKTAQVRNIELLPALQARLNALKRAENELISPGLNNRPARDLRRAAGLQRRPDAARHSFASYWLALYHDAARLQCLLGHSPGSNVLFNHYRAAVTEQAAKEYFAILNKL